MSERRVVITGCGALSCIGKGVDEIWKNLLAGECGIDQVTFFDTTDYKTKIGGEIKDFDPTKYMSPKEVRHMDRVTQLSLAAAEEAMTQSGLPKTREGLLAAGLNPRRMGSLVSSGVGGLGTIHQQALNLEQNGPGRLTPFLIPMIIIDIASGQLSIRYGFQGPNFGVVSACATGCHSIGESYHIIKRDDADVMLAGGAEAAIQPLCLGGFNALKALSQRNDDPKHASRPFDLNRDGFVAAEGAGVLVLEELEHAKKRGAHILGEIIGYGATGDGFHITSPDPEGEGDAEAFRMAIRHAGIKPEEIDYINAHGTSTCLNDKFETKAIKLALGDAAYKVAISSTKGATGHTLGAAGGLESIFCLKAIETGTVPPTINYETPDPECDLDITPNAPKKRDVRVAVNNNLGFGGHNAVVIYRKYEE